MIDISCEKLLVPAEIASLVPRRRGGKKCNIATIYRWMQLGIRGVKLEYLCVGSVRCTSVEALQRFFDGCTAQTKGQDVQPPPPRLTATRRKQIEAAERRLVEAGI